MKTLIGTTSIDAWKLGDVGRIVLRQAAALGAEAVFLKDDQRPSRVFVCGERQRACWTAPMKQNTNRAAAVPLTVSSVRVRWRQRPLRMYGVKRNIDVRNSVNGPMNRKDAFARFTR